MTRVYSLHLYRDVQRENYCGSWAVPVADGDPVRETLAELGFGCGRDEDGTISRGFFLADELDEQIAAARNATECYVVTDDSTQAGRRSA